MSSNNLPAAPQSQSLLDTSPHYDIGTPLLEDIWVDPVSGDDGRDGSTRAQALRTLARAWRMIPLHIEQHGWRIMLAAGRYEPHIADQVVMEDRQGTRECPIILQAADGPLSAELPMLEFCRCHFVYLLDVKIVSASNAKIIPSQDCVLHFTACRDVLVRNVTAIGVEHEGGVLPSIILKANQCLRLYVEDCDLSGAQGNALDYVAVQYGHIVRNRMHRTRSEVMYVKGGSAYHLIAGNEFYDGVNHGVAAGQGTGFEYMVAPWLHYEAYDIKIVNNIIHDAGGGMAVFGGYNILVAWNTCYRVGTSRDTIVVGLGGRGPSTWSPARCAQYAAMGGWCQGKSAEGFNIPNRNVQIRNNVILNPDGFESRFAHLGISGPVTVAPGGNLPPQTRADDGLVIRGNVIWNGPADKPLLDDVEGVYHLAARPTADKAQLLRDNAFNALRPELIDPERGNFRPTPGGNLYGRAAETIADFAWSDAPARPAPPPGNPCNRVSLDRAGQRRLPGAPPGAYCR